MKLRSIVALSSVLVAAMLGTVGCKSGAKGDAKGAADQAAAAKASPTGPVATVNGKPIARAEFTDMYDKMTRVYTRRNKEVPEKVAQRYKENILNRLVDKELLTQEMDRRNIQVTDAELNEALNKYKEMFRTEANFTRYLESSKTTLDKIKDNLRFNKRLEKLLSSDSPIEVTEDEAKEYYEANKHRYAEKERVKLSQVLIRLPKDADEKTKKDAQAKAQQVYKAAVAAKADFAEVAKKFSDDPRAQEGGDMGYVTKGRLPAEVEKVAFGAKVNEVSKPISSALGWYVVKITDKKAAGEKAYDEVKESINRLLKSRKERIKKSQILKDIKDKAKIEKFEI